MELSEFISGEPIVFEGSVIKKDKGHISVQLHPGLVVDIRKEDIESLEEAADEITGRSYIRIVVKPDCSISATFQPRVARLTMTSEGTGSGDSCARPFGLGGLSTEEEQPSAVYALPPAVATDEHLACYGVRTVGTFHTRCRAMFWGWINDDKTTTDRK
ncbi:hypothetical protein Maes01_00969 [Microbulbifer aestuariivivens]|uniref:Uncharacterized protein n=1 Tax=Microbulbifer aestuariivivens TaxID=1908308 RepID=A0ABP9WMJ4_9GAMM